LSGFWIFVHLQGMEFNKLNHVPSLEEIKQAAQQIQGVVLESPLEYASRLSGRYGATIYLKREDLQGVRSYKIRGAFHKISNIPIELRSQGIVAASAGNHAQGVALACARLGIQAYIFMPKHTPLQKVEAVRFHGQERVKIKLVGETFDEAYAASRAFCALNNAIYIPPFDDFDIIAGQATACLEILSQVSEPIDYLVLAVGGGGLAAGCALMLEYVSPHTRLIAVEPAQAASLAAALAHGSPITLPDIDSFVDGAAVKRMGDRNFAILQNRVDRVLKIEKPHLCQTMLDLYQFYGMIVEPAGALSVAALAMLAEDIRGKRVVCVVSGGNFDPKRFPEIKELAKNG
jgi:threonine dehydratase